MAKETKVHKTEEISLEVKKIYTEDSCDWGSPQFEGLQEGMYLCETSDSGQYIMMIDSYGGRTGAWLPIGLVIQNKIKDVKERTIADVLECFGQIMANLGVIEKLANENNIILNESEDVAKENAQTIAQSLVNLEKQFKELPKQTEGQKSSLSEMAEAVVNIIKATK